MRFGVKRRGFALTAEALIALMMAVAVVSHSVNQGNANLNEQFLYQQAQDIVEACTILDDLSSSCFDAVKTESINYCLNNCSEPMIKRDYIEFGLILT